MSYVVIIPKQMLRTDNRIDPKKLRLYLIGIYIENYSLREMDEQRSDDGVV